MSTLLVLTAFATDSGLVQLYDRQVRCDLRVEPPPDPSTCVVEVRRETPVPERPTWGISVAAPGKLFYSMHMPDIDWGHVYRVDAPRAFDPVVMSTAVEPGSTACPGESVFYLHAVSERGPLTKQVCAGIDWVGEGEVLLSGHRKLPPATWVPIWAYKPVGDKANDVNQWFIVQVYISRTGAAPERPPQHPYLSTDLVRASVPQALPLRKWLKVMGPDPSAPPPPEDEP